MKSHYLRDPKGAAREGIAETDAAADGSSPLSGTAGLRPGRSRLAWPVAALLIIALSAALWVGIAVLTKGLFR